MKQVEFWKQDDVHVASIGVQAEIMRVFHHQEGRSSHFFLEVFFFCSV